MTDSAHRELRLPGVIAIPVGHRVVIQTYERSEFRSTFSLEKEWRDHPCVSIEDRDTGIVHHESSLHADIDDVPSGTLSELVRRARRFPGRVTRCEIFYRSATPFTHLDVLLEDETTPYR
jgi:hypothetical protein